MKTLRFLSALLMLCFLPIRAFAMDTELVHNRTEWYNRADKKYINLENVDGLEGYAFYYTDLSNNCFYVNLSYTALDIAIHESSIVYLCFKIKNSSNEYEFNIDKNGFYGADENAMKAFNAEAEFGNLQNNGQVISAGVEFLNKEDKKLNNTLEITLHISNVYHYAFKIPVNDKLNYGDHAASLTTAKPTTTKHTTEAKTTTEKNTEKSTEKQTATKAITETPATEKATKTEPESTTKFKYIHTTAPTEATAEASATTSTSAADSAVASTTAATAATEKHSNNPIDGGTAFVYENATENKTAQNESTTATEDKAHSMPTENTPSQNGDIILPEAQTAGKLSPQAKLLASLAIVFAVLGTALIIRSLPKKEKVNKSEKDE